MEYLLDHIHIICRDLKQMINFFVENFSATLISMQNFRGADGASIDLNGTLINLRVPYAHERFLNNPAHRMYGYHHIGLRVENIDYCCKVLNEKGFIFSLPPKDTNDLRIAFFEGPENITIELVQTK